MLEARSGVQQLSELRIVGHHLVGEAGQVVRPPSRLVGGLGLRVQEWRAVVDQRTGVVDNAGGVNASRGIAQNRPVRFDKNMTSRSEPWKSDASPQRNLPNMTCGLNGQEFLQQFRPAYVTAEWAGRLLKEVRIWGPRVLQDGSLGKREQDHRWKRTIAGGGVKYSELPFSVATQLKSYTDRMS